MSTRTRPRLTALLMATPLLVGTVVGATSAPASAVPSDDRVLQSHDAGDTVVTETYDGTGAGVARYDAVPAGGSVRSVSDDGRRVAYGVTDDACVAATEEPEPACTDFFVTDAVNGRTVQVAEQAYPTFYEVRLSPDGRTFYYFSPNDLDELRKVLHTVPVDDPAAATTRDVQSQTDFPLFAGRALSTNGGVSMVEADRDETVVRSYTAPDAEGTYYVLSTAPAAGKALLTYSAGFDAEEFQILLLDTNTGVFSTWLSSGSTPYALDGFTIALAPDAGAAYLRSFTKSGTGARCGTDEADLVRLTPDGRATALDVPCGFGTVAVSGPTAAPSDPADSPAQLSLSPTTIAAGQVVTVTYRGAPGAVLDVLSRTQPATTFSRIGTVTLDSQGRGTTTHKPQRNTRITAQSARTGVSPSQPLVGVRSVTSFRTERVGTRTYTFTGRSYPALSNRLVSIYRNGVLVAQARCDASGIYKVTKTLAAGTFAFQARTPNDTYNVGANSALLNLTVR